LRSSDSQKDKTFVHPPIPVLRERNTFVESYDDREDDVNAPDDSDSQSDSDNYKVAPARGVKGFALRPRAGSEAHPPTLRQLHDPPCAL
jgi:hypothetical protein